MNERFNTIRFNLIFGTLYFLYEWLGMGAANDQYYVYFIKASTSVLIAFAVSCLSVHYLFSKFYLSDKKQLFDQVVAVVFMMDKGYINYHY